jgi:hypothetical protein
LKGYDLRRRSNKEGYLRIATRFHREADEIQHAIEVLNRVARDSRSLMKQPMTHNVLRLLLRAVLPVEVSNVGNDNSQFRRNVSSP